MIRHSATVLPFARKFPCKRKFWSLLSLQGKMQGIRIDKEIARKSSLSKEIERNFKILQIVSFNLKNKQKTVYISLRITGKVFLNLSF
jgi:hypothetical protein